MLLTMNKVLIYTDGSSRGNPGPGGYGALLLSGGHEKELSGGYTETTNNRMELMAVIVALEALKFSCGVEVFSDSRYVINALNEGWLDGWRSRGWAKAGKKPLLNVDLWKRLYEAMQGHDIMWTWVKGHAGHQFNERCDVLATAAADGGELIPDLGYEDSKRGDLDLFEEDPEG